MPFEPIHYLSFIIQPGIWKLIKNIKIELNYISNSESGKKPITVNVRALLTENTIQFPLLIISSSTIARILVKFNLLIYRSLIELYPLKLQPYTSKHTM